LKIAYYIILIIVICNSGVFNAQISVRQDTLSPGKTDTLAASPDTLNGNDILRDSIVIKFSKDSLDGEISYGALDSSRTDVANSTIHLYGKAYIDYQTIKVKASYIIYDFKSGILRAFDKIPGSDSIAFVTLTGVEEKPSFSEQQNTFNYKTLTYSFKSKKVFVTEALTREGEFFIHGEKTKLVLRNEATGQKEDIGYNQDAYFTTCDHPHPHFGIRSAKFKLIPNKLAVMSFAQLEIARVPTPLFLPFGFFPLAKGKSSGIIFPRDFEFNEQLGLGLREVGYYFPISQYADLRVTGDIYTRGSHGLRLNANYKKRYGYTGYVNLGYNNIISEDARTGGRLSSKAYTIQVQHNQDSKAHPYRRIGGNVNIQSNQYDQRTYFNPNAALTNIYTSNFSFIHSMPGTPFNFSAEFRHSQNTNTRIMDITFPNMTLRMNTINPFRPKTATDEKWYHNIAVSYNAEFRNRTLTTDTALFTMSTLDNLKTGLSQRASVSSNFRLLKYVNVVPNVNYEEFWLTDRTIQTFDPANVIGYDTIFTPEGNIINEKIIRYGTLDTIQEKGFYTFRKLNAGVSMNTNIFGTLLFSKGFIRGLRHQIKPSLNFNFTPETASLYERMVDIDNRPDINRPRTYSVFQDSPFGQLRGDLEQMSINYSILNIFEAKYALRDTIKKIRLLDNINVSGFYNIAADSLKWSDIRVNGVTRLFNGMTNINFSAQFSPYRYEGTRKTNSYLWETEKQLLGFRDFNLAVTSGISFREIMDMIKPDKEQENPNSPVQQPPQPQNANPADRNRGRLNSPPATPQESDIELAEWFMNFTFRHNFGVQVRKLNNRDTFLVSTHTIDCSGSIPLTKYWNVNIGSIGYDFVGKRITYPYFSFNRDLHCWSMNFTWAPAAGTYGFFIGVKSGTLDFLKYNYGQRNNFGSLGGRVR